MVFSGIHNFSLGLQQEMLIKYRVLMDFCFPAQDLSCGDDDADACADFTEQVGLCRFSSEVQP